MDGKVYHYRDKNNLECDAVVHLRNGSYGLIEVKLGGYELIKEGAESLKALSDKIDTTKMKKPSFLMVLTGVGDYAYKRPEDFILQAEGGLEQGVPVFQFQPGISEHGIAALAVEAGGIVVDLHLVEHVDMRLAGEL